MTQKEEDDFFNAPLKHKVPKETKTEGDAKFCSTCKANTIYANTGCAICTVPKGGFRLRYSGKYMMTIAGTL